MLCHGIISTAFVNAAHSWGNGLEDSFLHATQHNKCRAKKKRHTVVPRTLCFVFDSPARSRVRRHRGGAARLAPSSATAREQPGNHQSSAEETHHRVVVPVENRLGRGQRGAGHGGPSLLSSGRRGIWPLLPFTPQTRHGSTLLTGPLDLASGGFTSGQQGCAHV